jgi:predicted DNA-binding transcriptional regulator AlpA
MPPTDGWLLWEIRSISIFAILMKTYFDEVLMKNLLSIIQDEKASIKLEVSGEDLLEFSNDLINRAKSELSTEIAEARKERYLTRSEVKEICGVCDATLWHWNKKNYLKTIKVGSKVRYRMSDIKRILESKHENR